MNAHPGTTRLEITRDHFSEKAKVYQEGIVAGLIGAATISIWFLILDTVRGQPFYTPTLLGNALLHGGGHIGPLVGLPISFELVLFYTWIHGLIFSLLGGVAAHLLARAERQPNLGFGIVLLFVILGFGFIAATMVLANGVLQELGVVWVLLGNLLAAAGMAGYFKYRHPYLTIEP